MSDPVVIVGASLAALRTAESLRRFGYSEPITIIGDEPHLPYNRPPLSKAALLAGVGHADLAFPLREAVADVTWLLGTRIARADLDERTVTDDTGTTRTYRALVVASGVRPRRLNTVDPIERSGQFVLRTLDDAVSLRVHLVPGSRVVVIGSGFIGCEVAATARTLGCDVVVIGRGKLPLEHPLGEQLAQEMMRRHRLRGVEFVMETDVAAILGTQQVEGVQLSDGTVLDCDVVVEALGSEFNTEWLDGNDLDLEAGVRTDGGLRAVRPTSGGVWEGVYAIGDVARFPNARFGNECVAVGHWNIPSETAKRAAQVLAQQLAGDPAVHETLAQPFAPMPSFWSDQYDTHLLSYGMLSLADESRVVNGDLERECVVEYTREGELVGVCGIGLRSTVIAARARIGLTHALETPASQESARLGA